MPDLGDQTFRKQLHDCSEAILRLVDVAQAALDLIRANLATKQDIKASEDRIIEAINPRINVEDQRILTHLLARGRNITGRLQSLVNK